MALLLLLAIGLCGVEGQGVETFDVFPGGDQCTSTQVLQCETCSNGINGLACFQTPKPGCVINDETPTEEAPLDEKSVMYQIGQRMLRYLHEDNHDQIQAIIEEPDKVQLVNDLFDEDKDGKISAKEWTDLYAKLEDYWQTALGEEIPIPVEEWMTIDSNKDGFIDVETEMYPVLFTMTTEPVFRVLTSATSYTLDENRNGVFDTTRKPCPHSGAFIDVETEMYPVLFNMITEPVFRGLTSATSCTLYENRNGVFDTTPFVSTNPRFANRGNSEWEVYSTAPEMKGILALPAATTSEIEAVLEEVKQGGGVEAEQELIDAMEMHGIVLEKTTA